MAPSANPTRNQFTRSSATRTAVARRKGRLLARSLRTCCLLAIAACGRSEASDPAAPAQAQPEATSGAERAETRPGEPGAPAAPAPPPAPSDRIEDFMEEHFVIVTWSRDAVINGSLEALREPLHSLAVYDYATVAPGGWMPAIARIQETARLTSEAQSLDAAATGVAAMARQCGACHQARGRGPDFNSDHRETEATSPPEDSFGARMHRHMWAADRLWEGLTGPSESAWNAGASALAHAPVETPRTEPPLPADFTRALLEVRALGENARAATTLEARADIYGLFLASCAGCHAYEVEHSF